MLGARDRASAREKVRRGVGGSDRPGDAGAVRRGRAVDFPVEREHVLAAAYADQPQGGPRESDDARTDDGGRLDATEHRVGNRAAHKVARLWVDGEASQCGIVELEAEQWVAALAGRRGVECARRRRHAASTEIRGGSVGSGLGGVKASGSE